jgi:hypothetical protein
MKKLVIFFLILGGSSAVNAQGTFDITSDRELTFDVLHSAVAIVVMYISVAFILSMVRLWMNYQLRKKLVENEAPFEVIDQILMNKSESLGSLKWFIVLVFIGIGLMISSFLGSLGIQSVIIMTFSVALGFLSYYLISKRLNK